MRQEDLEYKGKQLAKAQRINKFLEDICWEDDILPELTKVRKKYDKLLIARALGTYSTSDPNAIVASVEELAGRVAGIDFIIDLFEDCIANGESAAKWLNSQSE